MYIMAEALDFSSKVEAVTLHKAKRPCKIKKTRGPSDSASADGNASTLKAAQAQGLEKPPQGQARKGRL